MSSSTTTPAGVTKAVNPATLEDIGEVPNTDFSQITEDFERARRAQKIWADTPVRIRRKHIKKMKVYIRENAEELAAIVSRDNGKLRVDALTTEVLPCMLACDWYGNNAEAFLRPKKIPMGTILFFNKKNQMLRVPLGVVGIISPWNYPLSIPFGEVVMGLMAGNAIMLKVAAATPLVGKAIADIVAAGDLPEGLFQLIVGSGGTVSRAFFQNKIDKIFFTGSVPVGKLLLQESAASLTPLSLELGGNDPMLVLEDADLERATNGAAWAGFQNAGQSCGGVERIYVHENIYDEFVELLAKKTAAMRHGPDVDHELDMGSMTTQGQLDVVTRHVGDAVKAGAVIKAQSKPVGNCAGYFYPATVLTNVDHTMEVMREETFGPVLPVMKFKTLEEGIQMANNSNLALTSSVWTSSNKKGREIAARLESGVSTVNDHLYTHGMSETPWGGWKESGLGRTHGMFGFEEMTNAKLVNWDILPSRRNLWWYPFSKDAYDAMINAMFFAAPKGPLNLLTSSLKLTGFLVKKMYSKWKV